MTLAKLLQARHQPQQAETGRRVQSQAIEADIAGGALCRHRQTVQDAGHLSEVLLADWRQCHAPGRSEKQLPADHGLEFGQLVADCRGRQVEQFGGAGDVAEACRLFEGLNGFQGWKDRRCIAR
ncbi:hypothetical protein D3C81_1788050 [compost metagenome]